VSQELPDSEGATPSKDLDILARRLRFFCKLRRLSLRQLGELSNTTASFLSQLERGTSGATTSTLIRISEALSISVADFFDERFSSLHRVLRRIDRSALPAAAGLRKTLLSQHPVLDFQIYLGEFDAGGSTGEEPYTHGNSHEMCVVLSGEVEIQLDGEPFRMSAGGRIEYSSATPHRVVNCGPTTAEVQWIVARLTVPAIPNKVVKSDKGL
jgi:transcriptional regulator with XRE-family HTH domain